MATAIEISVDAAMMAVFSELDGIFTLEKNIKAALTAFLGGQHCFNLLLIGFGENASLPGSLARQRSAADVAPHTNRETLSCLN